MWANFLERLMTSCLLTCWMPPGLRSFSRDEHGFSNKIERITLHGIEQKDQDEKKAKVENTSYNCLSIPRHFCTIKTLSLQVLTKQSNRGLHVLSSSHYICNPQTKQRLLFYVNFKSFSPGKFSVTLIQV